MADPRWRRLDGRGDSRPGATRALRTLALALAFTASCAGLGWVALWFRPPRPTELVLVGAGYGLNLRVPHNAWGMATLDDLAGLASASAADPYPIKAPRWSLPLPPAVWEDGADPLSEQNLEAVQGDVVLMVLSLHGGADEKGPYLLAGGASLGGPRLRIEEVLRRLEKTLKPSQAKVLILDATQAESGWLVGVARNDFARSLRALEERIAEVPNLVVIASSDAGERSWVDRRRGRTVFGDHLARGLAGEAAGPDGAVTASSLHGYLRDRVGAWALANRGRSQTPLILPEADRDRAGRIVLARAHARSHPAPLPPLREIPKALAEEWDATAALARQPAGARTRTLHAWRHHLATLRRFEELTLAGDIGRDPALDTLARQVQASRDELRLAFGLDLKSLSGSLAMPTLTGRPAPSPATDQRFESFWSHPAPEDAAKVWAQARADPSATFRFDELLQERAESDPADNLLKAAGLSAIIHDVEDVEPIELHTLAMFDQYRPLDPSKLGPGYHAAMGRALEARRLAEVAATGGQAGPAVGHGEEIAPAVAQAVDGADIDRRLGEDLLFSARPTDWDEAGRLFDGATSAYKQAVAEVDRRAGAFAGLDEAGSLLPGLSDWLARLGPAEGPSSELIRAWAGLRRLDGALRSSKAGGELALEPLVRSLDVVRMAYRAEVGAVLASPGPRDVPRLEALLEGAGPDWAERGPLLAALRAAVLAEVDSAPRSSVVPQDRAADEVALGRLRIARASLGLTEDGGPEALASAEAVEDLGRLLNSARRLLVSKVFVPPTATGEAPSLEERRAAVDRLATLADLIPGGFELPSRPEELPGDSGLRLSDFPEVARRDLDLQALLLRLARRAILDRWYDEDPEASPPYFQRATNRYLEDARSLDLDGGMRSVVGSSPIYAASSQLEAIEQDRDAATAEFKPNESKDPALTSEPKARFAFPVERLATGPSSAHPTFRINRVGVALQLAGSSRPDFPLAIAAGLPPLPLKSDPWGTFLVEVSSPLVALAESGRPVGSLTRDKTFVDVSIFWRGQVTRSPVHPSLIPVADLTVSAPRPTGPARVSVRADAPLIESAGAGRGGIAIVVDGSGSMGGRLGSGTKFEAVIGVVLKLLPQIPRGTLVGVWAFGQRIGPADTSNDAERTIRPIRPLAPWEPGDPASLDQVARDLRALTPYNESPVVRALVQAKDSLVGVDGPRMIVALTDGIDNRFDRDPAGPSPRPTIADYLIREFRDAETRVAFVGFRVDPRERAAVVEQFQVFGSPPLLGQLLMVDEAGSELEPLERAVRRAVRPEIRFRLDPIDGPAATGKGGEWRSVGLSGDPERPSTVEVEAGTYWLRISGQPGPGRAIDLEAGDSLAFHIEGRRGALEARLDTPPVEAAVTRAIPDTGWTVSLLGERWGDRGVLELDLEIDPDIPPDLTSSGRRRPAVLRVEASSGGLAPRGIPGVSDPLVSYPVRLIELPGSSPPNYRASIEGLPIPPPRTIKLVVGCWEPPDRPDQGVSSRPIGVEPHIVEVAPGRFESRSCLVVRVPHDPGQVALIRADGIPLEGVETREYAGLILDKQIRGLTTALFWPVDQRLLETRPPTLRIGLSPRIADRQTASFSIVLPSKSPESVPRSPALP